MKITKSVLTRLLAAAVFLACLGSGVKAQEIAVPVRVVGGDGLVAKAAKHVLGSAANRILNAGIEAGFGRGMGFALGMLGFSSALDKMSMTTCQVSTKLSPKCQYNWIKLKPPSTKSAATTSSHARWVLEVKFSTSNVCTKAF